MLSNLRLTSVSWIIAAVLAGAGAALVGGAIVMDRQVAELGST